VNEKSLLFVDDCTERTSLAWATYNPRESLLGPNYRPLGDHTAAIIVRVRGVTHDVYDVEFFRLTRLRVRHVYTVRADDLHLFNSGAPADSLEFLLALERLYRVPADLIDSVCPVGSLFTTRRLTFC